MADELIALREAPGFEESYFGPVLSSRTRLSHSCFPRVFSMVINGLLSYRKPVVSSPGGYSYGSSGDETLDDHLNRRILSSDLTVKALPALKTFSDHCLIGSYQVDAEGVKPPQEIILVQDGILKTMLSSRVVRQLRR